MNDSRNPTRIIVEEDNRKLELELSWDADVWDWAEAFRTILFWQTFVTPTIDRAINTKDDCNECDYENEDQEID